MRAARARRPLRKLRRRRRRRRSARRRRRPPRRRKPQRKLVLRFEGAGEGAGREEVQAVMPKDVTVKYIDFSRRERGLGTCASGAR